MLTKRLVRALASVETTFHISNEGYRMNMHIKNVKNMRITDAISAEFKLTQDAINVQKEDEENNVI
jgi:hypothetical protein